MREALSMRNSQVRKVWNMSPVCKIDNLSVAYHDRVVLKQVSLDLPAGNIAGIVGPNGAGKSTLIKAALGLIPSLTGETTFFGEPLARVRDRVGYMPQSADVDWDYPATVRDVVLMGTFGKLGWLKRPGRKERAVADEAMETVGIEQLAGRQIGQLSGGQKQRTFLARILAQQPDLFIMDEPFAGVDAASERAITDVLSELRDAGRTIFVVHHDLATLNRFCTWAVLLNVHLISAGPIASSFTTENLAKAYGLANLPPEVANTWGAGK